MNTIWLKLNDERFESICKWASRVIQFIIIPAAAFAIWWIQGEIKSYGNENFVTRAEYRVFSTNLIAHPMVTHAEYDALVKQINANDQSVAIAIANLTSEIRSMSANMRDMRDDIREIRKAK